MNSKINSFSGPTKDNLKLINEKVKEQEKNFNKKIKKIMNKLNKQT